MEFELDAELNPEMLAWLRLVFASPEGSNAPLHPIAFRWATSSHCAPRRLRSALNQP